MDDLVEIPADAPRRETSRNEVVMMGSVKQKKSSHDQITNPSSKRLFPVFTALAIIDSDMYKGPVDTQGNPTNRKGHCSILEMDDFTCARTGEMFKHWLLNVKAEPINTPAANQPIFHLRQYEEEGQWHTVKYGTQVKDHDNQEVVIAGSHFSVADTAMEKFCMTVMHQAAKSRTEHDITNVAF